MDMFHTQHPAIQENGKRIIPKAEKRKKSLPEQTLIWLLLQYNLHAERRKADNHPPVMIFCISPRRKDHWDRAFFPWSLALFLRYGQIFIPDEMIGQYIFNEEGYGYIFNT